MFEKNLDLERMDRIEIKGLKLRCIIGIHDWERKTRQDISISFTIYTDTRSAAASDSVEESVDYRALAKKIIHLVEASSRRTLESLAEDIAMECCRAQRVTAARVRVEKPGSIRFAKLAAVEIVRWRNPDRA